MDGPIEAISQGAMSGRLNDHPEAFAMEFFIRFPGTPHADQGKRARFRVTLAHADPGYDRLTIDVQAEVPVDAAKDRAAN